MSPFQPGQGDAADDLPLEDQEDDQRRQRGDRQRRDDQIERLGAVEAVEGNRDRLLARFGQDQQRPEEISPTIDQGENRDHRQHRFRQGGRLI